MDLDLRAGFLRKLTMKPTTDQGVFFYFLFLGLIIIWFFTDFLPPSIHSNVNRRKSEAFLAEVESALSRFQIDMGNYPRHTGQSVDGAAVLYFFLCKEEKVYLKHNEDSDFVAIINGHLQLVDAWGAPLHYRCFPMETPPGHVSTMNPTYDLWSTGGSPEKREKWITNWRG